MGGKWHCGALWFVLPIRYRDYQVKEGKAAGAWGTHGKEEKCIEGFFLGKSEIKMPIEGES